RALPFCKIVLRSRSCGAGMTRTTAFKIAFMLLTEMENSAPPEPFAPFGSWMAAKNKQVIYRQDHGGLSQTKITAR
ncbi:MAG: hypothetical protein KAH44_08810, partial [Oricola sp.]|nr:hypothetical protein [Oricola sp.]